jgi:hypothetical protein
VGIKGVGIMNSTAFSLLANSSLEVDENQISFGTIDFQPHPSNSTPIFESMDQDMDLTIRSLNFCVGSLGSIRLSDPTKSDPSASGAKTIAMSKSSVGSSSEANSPVSLATAEITGEKIAELDETMENLDLEVQLEDLMRMTKQSSQASIASSTTGINYSQVGDNSEELNENNNPVLNLANINRGANHLVEGETADSLASREKVRLSADEWKIIKTAVEYGVPIPADASKNMLLGYHYDLR